MIPVQFNLNSNAPIDKPEHGFHYIDQGNYQTLPLVPGMVMYSDSATSCIITLVIASNSSGSFATLAHLDSAACIDAFFSILTQQSYGEIQIYAQGANPPDNATSQQNAAALQKAIAALGSVVVESRLSLLQGDPRRDNRGDFGFIFNSPGTLTATNQPYTLALTDRDPTCGGQTVYCIMRRQEEPPTEIRNAGLPFTHAELIELSSIALAFEKTQGDPTTAFTNIVNMQSEEIRESWSTTPIYEADWFSDQLKMGACFALSMAPVTKLSEYYLNQVTEPPFKRLKQSLLAQS